MTTITATYDIDARGDLNVEHLREYTRRMIRQCEADIIERMRRNALSECRMRDAPTYFQWASGARHA